MSAPLLNTNRRDHFCQTSPQGRNILLAFFLFNLPFSFFFFGGGKEGGARCTLVQVPCVGLQWVCSPAA